MSALWTLMFLGCSSGSGASTPEELAAVADAIVAAPADADATLAAKGLDRAAFEAALYQLAADPAASSAYVAARKR